MPSNLMLTESALPKFTEGQSDSVRLKSIYNYLFMLVEQLRYSMANLGEDNFNAAELESIGLNFTSHISEQVDSLTATVNDNSGNIASLELTAYGLSSRVSNTEGNISTLTQTAYGLSSRISNAEGDITVISASAERIDWLIASGTSISDFTMTSQAISLLSQSIDLTGYVTITDLAGTGTTTINGANIATGTLSVDAIMANSTIYGVAFPNNIYAPSMNTNTIYFGINDYITTYGSGDAESLEIRSYMPVRIIGGLTVQEYYNGAYHDDVVLTSHNYTDYIDAVARFG